jgi:hypothetical protein
MAESERSFQVRPSVPFSVHMKKPGFHWAFFFWGGGDFLLKTLDQMQTAKRNRHCA